MKEYQTFSNTRIEQKALSIVAYKVDPVINCGFKFEKSIVMAAAQSSLLGGMAYAAMSKVKPPREALYPPTAM